MASDGDPRCGGRNAKGEAEKEVRPSGKTLSKGIEKKNRERQRRKLQGERIQLPRGSDKDCDSGNCENPSERNAERARSEGAHLCARIFLVVTQVHDAVDRHCGRTR